MIDQTRANPFMSHHADTRRRHWPHRWAWLLACATFPLVWWGGFVTATGSGMAFKDWLTSDGVFMPFYPWLNSTGEKFIEHGHRLLGMLAGILTIALVISLYIGEPRPWVRRFGVALLLGVIAQGVLGGMRVVLDERLLALIHGCTGPLFFAATAAMVAVTSRHWLYSPAILAGPDSAPAEEGVSLDARRARMARLYRLAVLTVGLAYLQLVLGAVVRHSALMFTETAGAIFQTAVFFHVILAVAVTTHVLMLTHQCFWNRISRGVSVSLAALIGVQLLLGVSTWMVKYGVPAWATRLIGETGHLNRASDAISSSIVTAHGAVGSLIVALSVVLALYVARQSGVATPSPRIVAPRTAGVIA